MDITYVDDTLTLQSLSDWKEVFSKHIYKYLKVSSINQ